ncbi:retropepsin-like aspartic protease family protein [Oricola thermophila]|uniref:TIGR02281 family clan AA aspartic protease n=1 Tax=Oricola thermophila TaxID=2742145 RepID=A0A6N1VFM8_9HYPH|nr:TIGR02281 family clan AA aspartic protease [Oricola thermophila]QKV19746.1 TIGR02281 family clan AA aspartic protease [Oricola thermophila]
MLRYVVIAVMMSISALGAVRLLHDKPAIVETAATVVRDSAEARRARETAANSRHPVRVYSGTERLRADRLGHYVADFSFNSRRVRGVVDTGATLIAMNESEARRAGIFVRPNEFIYPVNTANGRVNAARVVIDEVRLGTIRVRNVEAMVLEDDALDTVLIGMSFLNRLRHFEFSNGVLELKL